MAQHRYLLSCKVDKADVDYSISSGRTALLEATKGNHIAIADELLQHGANPFGLRSTRQC